MNKTTLRVVTTAAAPKLHIGKPAFIPLINGGTLYISEVVDFEERWDCVFVKSHTATFKIKVKNANLPKEVVDILEKYQFSFKYVASNAEYRDLELRLGNHQTTIHFRNDDEELGKLISTLKKRIESLYVWNDMIVAKTWNDLVADLENLYLSTQQQENQEAKESPFKIVRNGQTIYLTSEEMEELRKASLIQDGRNMILNADVEIEPEEYDKWVETNGQLHCQECWAPATRVDALKYHKYCPYCGTYMSSNAEGPTIEKLSEDDDLCLKIAEAYEDAVHADTGEIEQRIVSKYIAKYLKGE